MDPGRRRRESGTDARARRAAVTDTAVVMEAAAAFLASRPRSVAETGRRLRHLGYTEGIATQVIDELAALGYLDDAAFARSWVESRDRARPRGTAVLQRELAQRGVARAVIESTLLERATVHTVVGLRTAEQGTADATPSADMEAAQRLLARRRAAIEREGDPRKRQRKAYALLARNGFDPDVCRSATDRFLEPVDDDDVSDP